MKCDYSLKDSVLEEGSNVRLFKKVCAGVSCRQQTHKEDEAVEKKNKELGL
jgi:hypothetical protein